MAVIGNVVWVFIPLDSNANSTSTNDEEEKAASS